MCFCLKFPKTNLLKFTLNLHLKTEKKTSPEFSSLLAKSGPIYLLKTLKANWVFTSASPLPPNLCLKKKTPPLPLSQNLQLSRFLRYSFSKKVWVYFAFLAEFHQLGKNNHQLMVNWWGLDSWDLMKGIGIRIRNHRVPNHQFTISWNYDSWGIFRMKL